MYRSESTPICNPAFVLFHSFLVTFLRERSSRTRFHSPGGGVRADGLVCKYAPKKGLVIALSVSGRRCLFRPSGDMQGTGKTISQLLAIVHASEDLGLSIMN